MLLIDLQSPAAPRLKAPAFKPLGADEEVQPGTLLGIDTEFVAHSPPDKVMRGCVALFVLQAAHCAPSRSLYLINQDAEDGGLNMNGRRNTYSRL